MDNLQLVAFDAKCKAERPHIYAECKRLWFLYWELLLVPAPSDLVNRKHKELTDMWRSAFSSNPDLYYIGQSLWDKQSQEEN